MTDNLTLRAGADPCRPYCATGPCAPSCLRMDDPNPILIGDDRVRRTAARIRAARQGLEDAQMPNIPLRRAAEIYNGQSAPTAREFALYAEACGVTVDLLLTGIGRRDAFAAGHE